MKDAQAVNTIRWKIVETLKATGLPITCGSGGRTRYNREKAGLPKTHYYDAASVNCIPIDDGNHSVLEIHAVGYGHRGDLGDFQTKQKSPGFKLEYKRVEYSNGFAKLDIVEIQNRKGKFIGCLNSFDKTDEGKNQECRVKYRWIAPKKNGRTKRKKIGRTSGNVTQLKKIQNRDGYGYAFRKPPVKTDNFVIGEQLTLF